MNEIGKRIREIRLLRGMSQNQVARIYRERYSKIISGGFISDIEHGAGISVETLIRLSSILSCSAGELLSCESTCSVPNGLTVSINVEDLSSVLSWSRRHRLRENDYLYLSIDPASSEKEGLILRRAKLFPLEPIYYVSNHLYIRITTNRVAASEALSEIHSGLKSRYACHMGKDFLVLRT